MCFRVEKGKKQIKTIISETGNWTVGQDSRSHQGSSRVSTVGGTRKLQHCNLYCPPSYTLLQTFILPTIAEEQNSSVSWYSAVKQLTVNTDILLITSTSRHTHLHQGRHMLLFHSLFLHHGSGSSICLVALTSARWQGTALKKPKTNKPRTEVTLNKDSSLIEAQKTALRVIV